jgi:hypothetical protein
MASIKSSNDNIEKALTFTTRAPLQDNAPLWQEYPIHGKGGCREI